MKKNTLMIFGLVVILGAIYFFTKSKDVSVGIKKLTLPTFDASAVDRIEIDAKDALKMVKIDGNWFIDLGDNRVLADQKHVSSMLDAASNLKHSHYVTSLDEKFPDLGLGEKNGRVSLRIFQGEDVAWAVDLGKNAKNSGRYAMIPQSKEVHVLLGSFWPLTRGKTSDWRERDILPIKEGDVIKFAVTKTASPFLSMIKEEEQWKIIEGVGPFSKDFRADTVALGLFVKAVADLRASDFIDEEKQLGRPAMTFEATTKDKTYTLRIFIDKGKKDKYFAKRDDGQQVFEISKFAFEKLDKSAKELRDLSVLFFDKNAVQQISIRYDGTIIHLAKEDQGWRVAQPAELPNEFEFDQTAVDDMVNLLSGLRAKRIADRKDDRAQQPNWLKNWLVEIITNDGRRATLYASKRRNSKDEFLIKGNMDDKIYAIDGSRLATILAGLKSFKKEDFDLPAIDENTEGFKSLPPDVQRKLLDATKNK